MVTNKKKYFYIEKYYKYSAVFLTDIDTTVISAFPFSSLF